MRQDAEAAARALDQDQELADLNMPGFDVFTVRSSTMLCRNPFQLPDRLDTMLQPVFSLWKGRRRAENGMPFSDDIGLSDLRPLPGKPFLLRAFAMPERFRFESLSEDAQGGIAGRFVDEISPSPMFSYLRAQGSATIEATEPTFLRLTEPSGRSFSRLLLPMWGDGQINMLLGAVNG